MRIAVASGKGGTGKTTVATNLAWVASQAGHAVSYVDCDVEEPNGHLFLNPEITSTQPVGTLCPEADATKCTLCGQCGELCQYSAIVCVGRKVLIYPELCHACGGCALVCAPGAISEIERETGRIKTGLADRVRFFQGVLNVGEAMSTGVIHELKKRTPCTGLQILDAPPGTSCPVIETVRNSDLVLLVTEPTPFGLNDLQLAVGMVRALGLPFGVVINRAGTGSTETRAYCHREGIPILAELADDRRVAEAYSRGILASDRVPEFRTALERLLSRILDSACTALVAEKEESLQ